MDKLTYEFIGRRGETRTLTHSCPHGMTEQDLRELFPHGDDYDLFMKWMNGQTMSICDGLEGHHERIHDEGCMTVSKIQEIFNPGIKPHTGNEEFDWRCGYTGKFWQTDSPCKDNPHGVVVYLHDVARYLNGYPVID